MLRRTLNLGIVAHVDAGKTTLTERLLYAAGVIDEPGSVDKGTTQTDSLALERERGITIKSAVVSFAIDDVTVNLIDTPGHPDFIAEVERVLGVLDGAVLVISGVEGVQPQTRILMRALRRLRIPTLVFVNKLDRLGADLERTLDDISERLAVTAVPMVQAAGSGSRIAEALAQQDDAFLAAYLDGDISSAQTHSELVAQTRRVAVHPVFAGSAIKGDGVEELMSGIAGLLPAKAGETSPPLEAAVFKIERGPTAEKIAFVRVFTGIIRVRDHVHFGNGGDAKVTAIRVFEHGGAVQLPEVGPGQIAQLSGLRDIRIGDRIGDTPSHEVQREFAPPTLESVVVPLDPDDAQRLRVAVDQLAEQDPLIDVRQDDSRRELSVSLYGEVQKEVIEATLEADYGIAVTFRETTPIYVERPAGTGEAIEVLHADTNPYNATIGLRVDPAADDSGVAFVLDVDARDAPLLVYKNVDEFREHMCEYVLATLREGLFGWRVTDCVVTMTTCSYSVADGPPSKRGPTSTAADFRKLTPLVLRQALERAGTIVCEPTVAVRLELPTETIGAVLPGLARLGATIEAPVPQGALSTLTAVMPAARVNDLQRELPGLTRGEGVLDSSFAGYQPVSGEPPVRSRAIAASRRRR